MKKIITLLLPFILLTAYCKKQETEHVSVNVITPASSENRHVEKTISKTKQQD